MTESISEGKIRYNLTRERKVKKDKKLRLLLAPLIFMVLLFVPEVLVDIYIHIVRMTDEIIG